MSKEFVKEHIYSDTTPSTLMRLNENGDYIQRANLIRIYDSEGQPTNEWTADSRIINQDEYNEVFGSLALPSHIKTENDLNDIMEGAIDLYNFESESNELLNHVDSDQKDLMDGTADTYVSVEQIQADLIDTMEALTDIYSLLGG